MTGPYVSAMFGRFLLFLAILAFSLASAMANAHLTRLAATGAAAEPPHMVVSHVAHVAGPAACKDAAPRASDAKRCAAACATLLAALPPVQTHADAVGRDARQMPAPVAALRGTAPAPRERPPRLRLL